jgi:hypothetical protein
MKWKISQKLRLSRAIKLSSPSTGEDEGEGVEIQSPSP